MGSKELYDIAIVGAGFSGMTAAIICGRKAKVLLLERQERPGHKILVTGNGKCNLTNTDQCPDHYRSTHPEHAMEILEKYGPDQMTAFLKERGILTRVRDGYVYPYSEQAASVRDLLEDSVKRQDHITIQTMCLAEHLTLQEGHFVLDTSRGRFLSKTVILAAGGLAAGEKFGCDGKGYQLACQAGHTLISPLPALTALRSGAPFLKKLDGVRCKGSVSLMVDDQKILEETGELQWTRYGLSGVAVFNVSRYGIIALEEGKKVRVLINFFPEKGKEELTALLCDMAKHNPQRSIGQLFQGILHKKIVPVILKEAHAEESIPAGKCTQIDRIAEILTSFELRINGYVGYEKAQVTRGGIPLSELTKHMESKKCPGLFFAGEMTDVDGSCGGYNLTWAFSSGMAAAEGALHNIGIEE